MSAPAAATPAPALRATMIGGGAVALWSALALLARRGLEGLALMCQPICGRS